MDLKLQINGQPRVFPATEETTSLAHLIQALELKADRVAVEVNGQIIPRTEWENASLKTGDRLEVVHFVGGGSTDTQFA